MSGKGHHQPNPTTFIAKPVGKEQVNHEHDVIDVQSLLQAVGFPLTISGRWDDQSARALEIEQKRCQNYYPTVVVQPFVKPGDEVLFALACEAGIVAPLNGAIGWNGVMALHQYLVDRKAQYNRHGMNFSFRGIAGRKNYLVQLNNGYFTRDLLHVDCTTYVNLMLSIYLHGHAHAKPYRPEVGEFGGPHPIGKCARERYGFPWVKNPESDLGYFSRSEILKITAGSQGLWVLEIAKNHKHDYVHHFALLKGGRVYESNVQGVKPPRPVTCIDSDLQEKTEWNAIYLFGPK